MGQSDISDPEIDIKLQELRAEDERDIFAEWSIMQKRKFYEDYLDSLPQPTEVKNLDSFKKIALKFGARELVDVADSCLFDASDMKTMPHSYIASLTHYQSWQLAGTDKIYTFGSADKTLFVTRPRGTFVFWIRYMQDDVGMVIDAQTGWVEGFLTREVNDDGTFTYGTALQFKKNTYEVKDVYIMSKQLVKLDADGSYSSSVCEISLAPANLQFAVYLLRRYNPGNLFDSTHRTACDILLLFISEAAKNRAILQYTFDALNSGSTEKIPRCLDATVIKYDKSSQSANNCVGGLADN